MAKQNTVIVLDQTEIAAALTDYIKKHYGEDIDVVTKEVYAIGYRTDVRDTIDKIEIIVETEEIEDLVDEEEDEYDAPGVSPTVYRQNSSIMREVQGMEARSSGADIAFEALGSGQVTPRV